jgi:uncharacterized protein YbjQ (UPF0145 family)
MFITPTDTIPGQRIKVVLGVVFGSCVQTKNFGKDIFAALRSIIGGEAKGYTEMMEESRRKSTERMIQQAEAMGANAIISFRYTTSQTMMGAAEIMAFGTAVFIEPGDVHGQR